MKDDDGGDDDDNGGADDDDSDEEEEGRRDFSAEEMNNDQLFNILKQPNDNFQSFARWTNAQPGKSRVKVDCLSIEVLHYVNLCRISINSSSFHKITCFNISIKYI